MKSSRGSLIWGIVLAVVGVIALAQNLWGDLPVAVWSVPFAAGGLVFLGVYARNREHWWAVIPGLGLLGIAVMIAVADRSAQLGGAILFLLIAASFAVVYLRRRDFWWAVIPMCSTLGLAVLAGFADRVGAWGGTVFLLSVALCFAVVYLIKREFWWAVIPAGATASVALVPAVAEMPGVSDTLPPAVMFLGLAITFGLVFLLSPEHRKWALIPSGVLALLGVLLLVSALEAVNVVGPAILIVAGVFLLARAYTRRAAA